MPTDGARRWVLPDRRWKRTGWSSIGSAPIVGVHEWWRFVRLALHHRDGRRSGRCSARGSCDHRGSDDDDDHSGQSG